MIIDDIRFSDAQAITDDAYASNYWDKGAAGALGSDLYLVFRVHTTFVSAGGAKLQIEVRSSAGLTGSDLNSSYEKLVISKEFAVADLVANQEIWRVKLPKHGLKRYTQPYYEVSVSTFSAGKIDAFVARRVQVKNND